MSTPEDRLTLIQDTYLDAMNNEPADLAKANTPAQVTSIQANLSNAKSTYYAAIATALANNSAQVEAAFGSAQQALAAVKQARSDAATIPTLLGKLTGATDAATTLLNLAKGAAL